MSIPDTRTPGPRRVVEQERAHAYGVALGQIMAASNAQSTESMRPR